MLRRIFTSTNYENKRFFITGGSEGIGLAVAEIAVKKGAQVAIAARDIDKLNRAAIQLEKHLPKSIEKTTNIATVQMDVSDSAQVTKQLQKYIEKFGVPDIVVNCAGFARPGYLNELSIQDFHDMMNVNYFGCVHVCREIVPHFIEGKTGTIINVSSMAGFLGLFGYTGYCASKYAVVGFSEALAAELRPFNIQVGVLCPPNTRTPGLIREGQFKPADVLKTEEKVKVVDVEFVAKALFAGLENRKLFIIPTRDGQLAYYLKRYAPFVVQMATRRPT